MRFVFDTNTLVSAALIETSIPGQAFYEAIARGDILISKATLKEADGVFKREKFDRYVSLDRRKQFLKVLVREARLVNVAEAIDACRDPDDNKFLELAVSGSASCIVSGDEDLLVLSPFRGVPILKPSSFLNWLMLPE